MFKTIKNVYVFILLFKITIAQINLTKNNLDQVCGCKSSQKVVISIGYLNISTVDTDTFNGLNTHLNNYIY
jgi:hypothetical protein